MTTSLMGMRIAILVTDGFEESELTSPRTTLEQEGATTIVASIRTGPVQGYQHDQKTKHVLADQLLSNLDANDFDAVLLPGGVLNADTIRMDQNAQRFVQDMHHKQKPIAVICHGAWLLASARLVKNRTLTSWPSLQDDIRNAGGRWVDQQVVSDGLLISSRAPDDLPAFNQAMVAAFLEYKKKHVRGTEDEHEIGLAAG